MFNDYCSTYPALLKKNATTQVFMYEELQS